MMLRRGIVLAALGAVLLGAAPRSSADDVVVLVGPAPVRIWKGQSEMEKGQDLLAAGGSPDAIRPLFVCEVAPGTRASVTRAERSYAWEAQITEGPAQGCRGVVGPRDFKTTGELAARSPATVFPEGPAQPTPPARTTPSDRPGGQTIPGGHMILWYQFDELRSDGQRRTGWKPVAGWETSSQCDAARQRLTEADDEEIKRILERFDVLSKSSSGRLTLSHTPRENGLDLEMSMVGREGRRTINLEVRSHCFPASYNPQH